MDGVMEGMEERCTYKSACKVWVVEEESCGGGARASVGARFGIA